MCAKNSFNCGIDGFRVSVPCAGHRCVRSCVSFSSEDWMMPLGWLN